jgi:hypothetical protein
VLDHARHEDVPRDVVERREPAIVALCRPSVNLTEVEVRARGYRIEGGVPSAFA